MKLLRFLIMFILFFVCAACFLVLEGYTTLSAYFGDIPGVVKNELIKLGEIFPFLKDFPLKDAFWVLPAMVAGCSLLLVLLIGGLKRGFLWLGITAFFASGLFFAIVLLLPRFVPPDFFQEVFVHLARSSPLTPIPKGPELVNGVFATGRTISIASGGSGLFLFILGLVIPRKKKKKSSIKEGKPEETLLENQDTSEHAIPVKQPAVVHKEAYKTDNDTTGAGNTDLPVKKEQEHPPEDTPAHIQKKTKSKVRRKKFPWVQALSIAGGLAAGFLLFLFSGFTNYVILIWSPLFPILVLIFGKQIDRIFSGFFAFKKKIPPLVLFIAGLGSPFVLSLIIGILSTGNYALTTTAALIIGSPLSFLIMRQPAKV
jgi:hypothetical protein